MTKKRLYFLIKNLHKNKVMRKILLYLFNFILMVLLIYLLFGIMMIIYQDRFLYHPSDENFFDCEGFNDYERVELNGTRFYFKNLSFSDNVIIYYSGNSGRACDRSPLGNYYEGYQSSVIFVEYSGYGGDNNSPNIDLLQQDVKNLINFTKQYENVYVVGESLGSSLAAYHSYLAHVDIVLLLAPFSSTTSLGEERFPYYPISFLGVEDYNTKRWLENYEGRVVLLHGEQDQNIPYTQSIELFSSLDTKDKHLFILPYAKHNDLYFYFDTVRVIRYTFLNRTYSDRLERFRYIED